MNQRRMPGKNVPVTKVFSRRQFLGMTGAAGAALALGAGQGNGVRASDAPSWPNQAEVISLAGRPTLHINGDPQPPIAYMSYLGETPFYQEVAEAGVHLYCFPAYLGGRGINTNSGIGPFRQGIWTGEDEFDFSSIEQDFAELLAGDPEARAIIRLHMDPPGWWEEAHPEACCWLPDGSTFRQCFSSHLWRDATSKVFLRCLDWLQVSPYAEHLVGIHVAAGFTEEWFYHFRGEFHDENPARTTAFRDWLRRTYDHDEAALQAAWKEPDICFDTAEPTSISGAYAEERWLPKDEYRARFDTMDFHTATMAENIAWFCRLVKEHSDGRLLTGAFYGYHYFVTDNRRGHGALGQLLACPDLDYLSSPNVYNRVMGADWTPMVAVPSVQRHGKLWLAENDTRTVLTTPLKDRAPEIAPPGQYEDGVWIGPDSLSDSVTLMQKNVARMLTYGYGGWWFDMWGGWFSDPAMLAVIARSVALGRENISRHCPAMEPQVAVVVDEALSFQDGSYGRLSEGILGNRYHLGKIGCSYELLLRDDMKALTEKGYRFVWLMGVTDLCVEEEALLANCLETGAHVLHTDFHDSVLRQPDQDPVRMETTRSFAPSELRRMMQEADVYQYVDSDDVVYAGNAWLGIHSVEGGLRMLHLPEAFSGYNAFTGVEMFRRRREVEIHLEPRSTLLLRLEQDPG